MTLTLPLRRLPHGRGLPLPTYATEGAAGLDLLAALEGELSVGPGKRVKIPTGIEMAIPPGYEGQIRPRSGLAWKKGLTVVNAPGTIDCDYRGEVQVLMINLGGDPIVINRGMKIAQMVFAPVIQVSVNEMDHLPSTARGDGGFGSTGT